VSGLQNVTPLGEPLRIGVAVDGSAPASRAVAHALSLVAGRPKSEIVLVNAQNLQTLDISYISAVMTVEVDRRLAAGQSRTGLRRAITLCRKAQTRFVTRARDRFPGRDHRPHRA
jgi:hypothetical protein